MPSSPRAGAVRAAADKTKPSISGVEAQLERFLRWLHVRFPSIPLCRSGQHFWLAESDRSKCCNGYRRARVFLTVNGFGHVRYYWREINSTDDKPFSWEPPPTNRSSRLTVRGDIPPTEARGDDHVNVVFHQTHTRAASIPRVEPRAIPSTETLKSESVNTADQPGAVASKRAAVPVESAPCRWCGYPESEHDPQRGYCYHGGIGEDATTYEPKVPRGDSWASARSEHVQLGVPVSMIDAGVAGGRLAGPFYRGGPADFLGGKW